jgi:dihydroorotate dehydrogenase (fumarate)
MPDLSTSYLGLHLANPLVPSASPLSRSIDTIRRMEDAGAAAIVLHSLFQEQVTVERQGADRYPAAVADRFWEAVTYAPAADEFPLRPEQYLEHVRRARAAVDIPIIGSLNGVSVGDWIDYVRLIEEAGAQALELNSYFIAADPLFPAAQVDERTVELVREVRHRLHIPLAVKLTPFYSNLSVLAARLVEAGAQALVLFNRFNQPDVDLDTLEVVSRPFLSRGGDEALRLPLRWIAILRGQLDVDLAASGGVHSAEDALKLLVVGANVTMLASELLLSGVERLRHIRQDLERWLTDREYDSIEQLRECIRRQPVTEPSAFERSQYLRAVGTSFPVPPEVLAMNEPMVGFAPVEL